MQVFTNLVPLWVSILFIISILIPIFLIAFIVEKGSLLIEAESKYAKRNRNTVILFYILYFIYAISLSLSGILSVNALPPRVILLTTLPLLLFYFIIIFRKKIYWDLLHIIKLESLIRIHIFRLIGVFFLIAYYYQALPRSFAFIAGFGDLFVAITAIFVAKIAQRKDKNYKTVVLIWNIVGFWDIVSVLVTALIIAKSSITTGSQTLNAIASSPFVLIPAFAPATIIFLHISIFKKLKMN